MRARGAGMRQGEGVAGAGELKPRLAAAECHSPTVFADLTSKLSPPGATLHFIITLKGVS